MKNKFAKLIRIALAFCLLSNGPWILLCMAGSDLPLTPYSYSDDFETSDPFTSPVLANGTYTEHFKGLSGKQAADGTNSLRVDVTLGTATYLVYQIPIGQGLGKLRLSGDVLIESSSGNISVSLGTRIEIINVASGRSLGIGTLAKANSLWVHQSQDLLPAVNNLITTHILPKFGGATPDDFGCLVNSIALFINRKPGSKPGERITLYVDRLSLNGEVPDGAAFKAERKAALDSYKNSVIAAINREADDVASIPDGPDITTLKEKTAAARASAVSRGYPSFEERQMIRNSYWLLHTVGYDLFPWLKALSDDHRILPHALILPVGESEPTGNRITFRTTRGEFNALSFGIKSALMLSQVKVTASDFRGSEGTIPRTAFDPWVVKPWYRMNDKTIFRKSAPILVPELLLKDNLLVKVVDEPKPMNFLKVTRNGSQEYLDITTPSGAFPSNCTVQDADTLQPFDMPPYSCMQILGTFHTPRDTPAGDYQGTIEVAPIGQDPQFMEVQVTVLPFDLAPSLLEESIFYPGRLTRMTSVDHVNKSPSLLAIDLANMRDHGILYPAVYQPQERLGEFLEIMKSVGLPTDHLYWLGLGAFGLRYYDLTTLKAKFKSFIDTATVHGFQDPHIYGIDEARGDTLRSEIPAFQAIHEAGAKVFASGYADVFDIVGDVLDVFNRANEISPDEVARWHGKGHRIFSYGNPQSGAQTPDLYRRNYGVELLLAGYDGAMMWAYQFPITLTSGLPNIWNNFEISSGNYGGLTLTYPTSEAVINTIPLKGLAAGGIDVRYLSTLIKMYENRGTKTKDQVFAWAGDILSANPDLDAFRQKVIDEILSVQSRPILSRVPDVPSARGPGPVPAPAPVPATPLAASSPAPAPAQVEEPLPAAKEISPHPPLKDLVDKKLILGPLIIVGTIGYVPYNDERAFHEVNDSGQVTVSTVAERSPFKERATSTRIDDNGSAKIVDKLPRAGLEEGVRIFAGLHDLMKNNASPTMITQVASEVSQLGMLPEIPFMDSEKGSAVMWALAAGGFTNPVAAAYEMPEQALSAVQAARGTGVRLETLVAGEELTSVDLLRVVEGVRKIDPTIEIIAQVHPDKGIEGIRSILAFGPRMGVKLKPYEGNELLISDLLRQARNEFPDALIGVAGGVTSENAASLRAAGASFLAAGIQRKADLSEGWNKPLMTTQEGGKKTGGSRT